MSFFSKQETGEMLPNRFVGKWGIITCGYNSHPPRANSSEEIKNSIKLLAKEQHKNAKRYAQEGNFTAQKLAETKAKDIEDFIKVMDDMPKRHLSLAHDVIDLSNTYEMSIFPSPDLNLTYKNNITGKDATVMGNILYGLNKLSKENPSAANLAEEIVSHSDPTNAKYFLWKLISTFPVIGNEKQCETAEPLVDEIAKNVLKGGPSCHLNEGKERQFYDIFYLLCQSDTKPQNLKFTKDAIDKASKYESDLDLSWNLSELRKGETETIKENIEYLSEVLDKAKQNGCKDFDVSGFLTKNVNMG